MPALPSPCQGSGLCLPLGLHGGDSLWKEWQHLDFSALFRASMRIKYTLWFSWEPGWKLCSAFRVLLGNLSSCCNPWIYMGFNSHLWPRPLRLLACCGGPGRRVRRQLSDGSLSSRRATLPTRSSAVPTLTLSPTLSGRPGREEPLKVSEQVDAEALAETGVF